VRHRPNWPTAVASNLYSYASGLTSCLALARFSFTRRDGLNKQAPSTPAPLPAILSVCPRSTASPTIRRRSRRLRKTRRGLCHGRNG
jgi:hypothetical protein